MSNHHYAHAGTGPGFGSTEPVGRWLHRVVSRLGDALDLYRQRRALLALDAARLEDIGVSRAAALAEGKRPVWR